MTNEHPDTTDAGTTEPSTSGPSTSGVSRRALIGGGVTVAAVAGIGIGGFVLTERSRTRPILPTDTSVAATERARSSSGQVVRKTLTAERTQIDLGGRIVDTSAYGGSVHGPLIRASAGDELKIGLENGLPASTTVHWHGLALRNDMDGVPGLTMKAVPAGDRFDYSFIAPHPGTYWYHPHVGTQLDTGLYGPLIIDDPRDPGDHDVEAVLMLDDWTDGWGRRPDAILDEMKDAGMGGMGGTGGMGGMRPTKAQPLGADTGDVSYPAHLINGRLPADPVTVAARPGQRVKLRLINAGGDTAYRFAVEGHRLTVSHTDGFAVEPVTVDTLILGMGERYDVTLTARDGAFSIVASPEGKDDPSATAILRTAQGPAPTRSGTVPALAGRLLTYRDLQPVDSNRLPMRSVDRTLDLTLDMSMGGRQWRLNGKTYADSEPLTLQAGERVRVRMRNRSMMFHPMHLHGHTFALAGNGTRKDTVNVLPMSTVSIDFEADNPGQWLMHCHNLYHGELGMMTVVSYVQ